MPTPVGFTKEKTWGTHSGYIIAHTKQYSGLQAYHRGFRHVVQGRSRMTADPRISIHNAGTEHDDISPPVQALLAPNAKRREVFGGGLEGWPIHS